MERCSKSFRRYLKGRSSLLGTTRFAKKLRLKSPKHCTFQETSKSPKKSTMKTARSQMLSWLPRSLFRPTMTKSRWANKWNISIWFRKTPRWVWTTNLLQDECSLTKIWRFCHKSTPGFITIILWILVWTVQITKIFTLQRRWEHIATKCAQTWFQRATMKPSQLCIKPIEMRWNEKSRAQMNSLG